MSYSKYGKYIVTELKDPFPAEYAARYAAWATRILWLDDKVVEGANQMNCSWYMRPPGITFTDAHTHDADEIIGFFGSNPDDPENLNAEVEIWIEDDMHLITKSAMLYMPAGLKHCPLILRRVDRPIFHFTVVTGKKYIKNDMK